jgi:arginine exporter protein ArgO
MHGEQSVLNRDLTVVGSRECMDTLRDRASITPRLPATRKRFHVCIFASSRMTAGVPNTRSRGARELVQLIATVVGAVFILVGILGFIPGITTHYSDMAFAGHDSMAKLLGIFMVSILHNVVHLLFGVAGLASARTAATARTYLIAGGVVYLVLWIYGLVVDQMSSANFVPVNTADNWLHFVLGVGMIALGFVFGRRRAMASY